MSDAMSILMIEDDEGHARLIEKNIRRAGVANPIMHFKDGTSALRYIFGEGSDATPFQEPALVILDLNLPDMSGADILRRLKENLATKRLPVIILTTTDDKLEIERCYDLGCNMYVTKPLGYQRFAEAVRQLRLMLGVIQIPEPAQN